MRAGRPVPQGSPESDPSQLDGTTRKLLDVSRLTTLGWKAEIGLEAGVRATFAWFLEHVADGTLRR